MNLRLQTFEISSQGSVVRGRILDSAMPAAYQARMSKNYKASIKVEWIQGEKGAPRPKRMLVSLEPLNDGDVVDGVANR